MTTTKEWAKSLKGEFGEVEKVEEVTTLTPVAPIIATDWEPLDHGETCTVSFSTEYGYDPTVYGVPDHPVIKYRGFDEVPALDENYIPDKANLAMASYALYRNEVALVMGWTGSGKTSLAEWICANTGKPFMRIEGRDDADRAEIVGMTHLKGGDTVFKPGDLVRGIQGPYLVVLDEVFKNNPHFLVSVYQRYLDRREFHVPEMDDAGERSIKPHAHTRMICTDNTLGNGDGLAQSIASNVQDDSFRNRMDRLIVQDYMTMEQERTFIARLSPEMPKANTKALAKLSYLLHELYKKCDITTAFSPRQLKKICQDFNYGMTLRASFDSVYLGFCSEADTPVVEEAIRNAGL
jgi:cobaltochelatase CobS